MRKVLFGWALSVFALLGASAGQAADKWIEGVSYTKVSSPNPKLITAPPGKIEVLDVFSYACPACNAFEPILVKMIKQLPPEAQMEYLPAGFQTSEDWPVFQRAFLTAQFLNVAEKSHDAMYDAVWGNGSLATTDKITHQVLPLREQPTIEDVAKFYQKFGVDPSTFVADASSIVIDGRISDAEEKMRAYQIMSTPTLIVNGKYMVSPSKDVSFAQMPEIVLYLVNKEKAAKSAAK